MNWLRPVTNLGLLFHGLHYNRRPAIDGQPGMALPNGKRWHADQLQGCRSRLMIHPGAREVFRTAAQQVADLEAGVSWPQYLLICGSNNCVGNGPIGDGRWLYFDPVGTTWLLGYTATPDNVAKTIQIDIHLYGRFGFYSRVRPFPQVDKVIGSLTFSPQYDSRSGSASSTDLDVTTTFAYGLSRLLEFNTDGSQIIINVRHPEWWYWERSRGDTGIVAGNPTGVLCNVLRFDIAGTGLLERDAPLGDGITATGEVWKDYTISDGGRPDIPGATYAGPLAWWVDLTPSPGELSHYYFEHYAHFYFDDQDQIHSISARWTEQLSYITGGQRRDVWAGYYIDHVLVNERTAAIEDTTPPLDELWLIEPKGWIEDNEGTGLFSLFFGDPTQAAQGYRRNTQDLVLPTGQVHPLRDWEDGELASVYPHFNSIAYHPVTGALFIGQANYGSLYSALNPEEEPCYI